MDPFDLARSILTPIKTSASATNFELDTKSDIKEREAAKAINLDEFINNDGVHADNHLNSTTPQADKTTSETDARNTTNGNVENTSDDRMDCHWDTRIPHKIDTSSGSTKELPKPSSASATVDSHQDTDAFPSPFTRSDNENALGSSLSQRSRAFPERRNSSSSVGRRSDDPRLAARPAEPKKEASRRTSVTLYKPIKGAIRRTSSSSNNPNEHKNRAKDTRSESNHTTLDNFDYTRLPTLLQQWLDYTRWHDEGYRQSRLAIHQERIQLKQKMLELDAAEQGILPTPTDPESSSRSTPASADSKPVLTIEDRTPSNFTLPKRPREDGEVDEERTRKTVKFAPQIDKSASPVRGELRPRRTSSSSTSPPPRHAENRAHDRYDSYKPHKSSSTLRDDHDRHRDRRGDADGIWKHDRYEDCDRDRGRDRERERERKRDHDRDYDRDRDRARERDRSREFNRDGDRERSRERDHDRDRDQKYHTDRDQQADTKTLLKTVDSPWGGDVVLSNSWGGGNDDVAKRGKERGKLGQKDQPTAASPKTPTAPAKKPVDGKQDSTSLKSSASEASQRSAIESSFKSHQHAPYRIVPCRYFGQPGGCHRGSACTFIH